MAHQFPFAIEGKHILTATTNHATKPRRLRFVINNKPIVLVKKA